MQHTPPFPYFGGKQHIAHEIWRRFGVVDTYIEPFAGSLATLLAAPCPARFELVGDVDGFVTNLWRAIQSAPKEVAMWADRPVNELDMRAIRAYLQAARDGLTEALIEDIDFFDAKSAGYWLWGMSVWPWGQWPDKQDLSRPKVKGFGMGIHALCRRERVGALLASLSRRLKHVRVLCGDWKRCLSNDVGFLTRERSTTALMFDPPYGEESGRHIMAPLYAEDDLTIAAKVAEVAREMGEDRSLRIALCGLDGEHEMPGWEELAWTSTRGGKNADRERIWFSPGCLGGASQTSLFTLST